MHGSHFREAIELKDWDLLEERWLELVERDLPHCKILVETLELLVNSKQARRATSLLELTMPALEERGRHSEAIMLLRFQVQSAPNDATLRQKAIDLYQQAHAEHPDLETLIDRAQRDATEGAASLVQALDRLFTYRVGTFVEDSKGWGFGQVKEVDYRRLEIVVDFESKRNHRIPIESAVEFLTVEDADRFECKLLADKEFLVREAEEDPANLVRRYLRSRGLPTPLRVIRQAISGVIIPEKSWSKMWAKARAALVHDPYVEISQGSQPTLTLRVLAQTREQDMRREIERTRTAGDLVKLVRTYLGETPGAGRIAFLEELGADLARRFENAKNAGDRAEYAYLIADVAPGETTRVEALVADVRGFADRVARMQTREYAVEHVKDLVKTKPPGWEAALGQMLSTEGVHASARDAAERAAKTDEALAARNAAFGRLLETPRAAPEAFFWMSGRVFDGKMEIAGVSKLEVLERHLNLLAQMGAETAYESSAEARALVRAARRAISLEVIAEITRTCDAANARSLSLALARNIELEGGFKAQCRAIIIEVHPEAAAALIERDQPDNFILTTKAGLKKRNREYEHLLSVEIKANGVALGKARELGDLSENAEWDAAREEERRLVGKQRQMSDELARAKEIVFGSGPSARVAVGSRVTVEEVNASDTALRTPMTYTILGPWDVDSAAGVISYQSPLGLGLVGRAKGEVVDVVLPTGQTRVRVLDIIWASPSEI